MKRLLVPLDPGEAPDILEEAIVSGVVVDGANLADEYSAGPCLAVESVVDAAFQADALSRAQDDPAARSQFARYAVDLDADRILREALVGRGAVKLEDQSAAAAYDDVFRLGPVEMQGRL